MREYPPISGNDKEKIEKWLATTEYSVFQKSLDSTIDSIFYEVGNSVRDNSMDFVMNQELSPKNKLRINKAMRLRICSEVLQEVLAKKTILKTDRYVTASN